MASLAAYKETPRCRLMLSNIRHQIEREGGLEKWDGDTQIDTCEEEGLDPKRRPQKRVLARGQACT